MRNEPIGFDILHNFISPVTGRVLATTNYVLLGDSQGIATPSPILIDLKLDLNALKKRYNTLVEADFIVGHPNYEIPDAQVLVNLADGFMYNTAGIVSTTMVIPIGSLPDLAENNIWIGDATNRPVAQQRVKLLNLPSFLSADIPSNLGLKNLYTGKSLGLTSPTEAGDPTTTMRIDMCNTPNLTIGKMWIGVSNPTPPVITIDGTFPYVHITGSLNWDAKSALPPPIGGPEYGVANEIGLNPGELFIGSSDPTKVGQITTTTTLTLTNFPDLTYKSIWRGDVTNRPVESTDLTTAENNIITLQTDVATINAEILVLQGQVAAIEVTLYTPVVGLVDVVAGLVTTVAGLSTTVSGLVTTVAAHTASIATLFTLSARTLDQIPLAAADVDINNHKLINVNDPVNVKDAVNLQTLNVVSARTLDQIPLAAANVDINNHRLVNVSNPVNSKDAVNLQTLNTAIAGAGTVTSVTGTTNQITVINNTTTPVVSLPVDVSITTSLTVANLKMVSNTIQSQNTNGDINLNPNGTGNVVINSGSAITALGVRMTPSYAVDVGGAARVCRLFGNADPSAGAGGGQVPTITLGATGVVGTGATASMAGTLIAGRLTITTGTGILTAGLIATFTLALAMPSSTFMINFSPASQTAAGVSGIGVGLYMTSTSSSQFTFTAGGTIGLTASTTYIWNYSIIGY